ncbi:MAG TPA: hypothetical protein VNR36_11975 [Pseudolysinimonas sp.]|nr:hypothetical protein [Pseudolysinimonas sp.]
MVLKVPDDVPLVWRTPSSVQFGVDEPVVIDDVGPGLERMLSALRAGISRSGWQMLAREAGIDPPEARALLRRLGPVLAGDAAIASPPAQRVLVTGTGAIATTLASLLRESGVLAVGREAQPDLAVLVAEWVIGPDDAAHWLRRDVPHLPIVGSDRAITVGPFVEPGRGPCIYCLQLTRRDADPAWPAIVTQLWGRPGAPRTQLADLTAATFAARRILERLGRGPGTIGRGWRLAEDGARISAWTTWTHPECSCAAPPESDWVPGPDRADPVATTTG